MQNLGPSIALFPANVNLSENDAVSWWSQLREHKQTDDIVEFFRKSFPFIESLEVLQPPGTPAALFANLTSGTVRRLTVLSAGITKIVSMLLACTRLRRGVVLIDEIENGIFYDKYAITWHILNKFSKGHDCQLFITSHSAECLQKLVQVIGDDVDDFSLLRSERENGKCVVRHISGASMKAALKRGGEIRGGGNGSSQDN